MVSNQQYTVLNGCLYTSTPIKTSWFGDERVSDQSFTLDGEAEFELRRCEAYISKHQLWLDEFSETLRHLRAQKNPCEDTIHMLSKEYERREAGYFYNLDRIAELKMELA